MTKTVKTCRELRRYVRRVKRAGRTIGLVPTMGALHKGHLSLVRRSVAENDRTIVSIFVNPTQFAPGEDLTKYPRPLARDVAACRGEKVDVVFAPTAEEIYPEGFTTTVQVEGLSRVLCGRSRPTHFRGVTTVCAKLFGLCEPDRAYFGEKDYQQLVIIRRMVADLNMTLQVVACPEVREPDGLAMSSRNKYLTAEERRQAPALYRSLMEAKRLVEEKGLCNVRDITRAVRKVVRTASAAKIDYVSVVHPETLEALDTIEDEAVVAVAVYLGKARLIDNMKVRPKVVDVDERNRIVSKRKR